MKKLYFNFIVLLLIIPITLAQNPNNHWQLGVSDVNFTTNQPTVSTIGNNNQYGRATISDNNGNLLFYTDGNTIWNKNHTVMTNGNLYSAPLDFELDILNTIIVPVPNNSNKYFVFNAINQRCLCLNGPKPSYYLYSIVEFDTLNPLGIVKNLGNTLSADGAPTTSFTNFLKDSNNGIVTNPYHVGPLTLTKSLDNSSYWIIVQQANKLLSYKIDSSGVIQPPIESIFPAEKIYYAAAFLSNIVYGSDYTTFKISPNNSFLIGKIRAKVDISPAKDFFYKVSFDSSTGIFSSFLNLSLSENVSIKDFEISNNSNNLFYVKNNGEIKVKDLLNVNIIDKVIFEYVNSSLSSIGFSYLEKDKYGNILTIKGNSLNSVDNQDSFLNSSIKVNFLNMSNVISTILPQIIPEIQIPCPNTLVITTNVTSGLETREAQTTIEASNTINSGAAAIYHAGTNVTLKLGFNAKTGCTFRAYQAGCSGAVLSRQTLVTSNINQEIIDVESKKIKEVIKIAPNPNNGIFTLSLDGIYDGFIEVADLYGFVVFKSEFKNQTEFELNMEEQRKGIYVAKLISTNQTYTAKIIKR